MTSLEYLDAEWVRLSSDKLRQRRSRLGWLAEALGSGDPAPPMPGETLMDFCLRAEIPPSEVAPLWNSRLRCVSCDEPLEDGTHVVFVRVLGCQYNTCMECEESYCRWLWRIQDWPGGDR